MAAADEHYDSCCVNNSLNKSNKSNNNNNMEITRSANSLITRVVYRRAAAATVPAIVLHRLLHEARP